MLTVILEDAGVEIGERDISVTRRAMLIRLVQDFHCFEHGAPSGVARLDVRSLACRLERPCCRPFVVKLAETFAIAECDR